MEQEDGIVIQNNRVRAFWLLVDIAPLPTLIPSSGTTRPSATAAAPTTSSAGRNPPFSAVKQPVLVDLPTSSILKVYW